MSTSAVGVAIDVVLTGAAVALIALGAYVVVRSRRARTVRLFGRNMYRPMLWASSAVCIGLSALLGVGNLAEVTRTSWQGPTNRFSFGLLMTGVGLQFIWLYVQHRHERRIGAKRHGRP